MCFRKLICVMMTVILLSLPLTYFDSAADFPEAVAEYIETAASSNSVISSAIKSLQQGTTEQISASNAQGNLGTFFEYYMSGNSILIDNAKEVVGTNMKMLSDQVDASGAAIDKFHSLIKGIGDTAYRQSISSNGFFEEKVGSYYHSNFWNVISNNIAPAQAWLGLKPNIKSLIPPDRNDTGKAKDDSGSVGLDQFVGYSKDMLISQSGSGILDNALLDILTPLWSSVDGLKADFSTSFTSNVPIVAERVMYTTGDLKGATCMKHTFPALKHYFSEGYVINNGRNNSNTYFLLYNDNEKTAKTKIEFFDVDGNSNSLTVDIPPKSRVTITASDYISGEFSTVIESDLPVAVERSVYLDGLLNGSTCENGVELSSHRFFAEGYAASDFETYFTIFNPSEQLANVSFSFLKNDGSSEYCDIAVPSRCRMTVHANDFVSGEFSTEVRSSTALAIERAVYAMGTEGGLIGATCAQGQGVLSKERHFAEGFVKDDEFATYFVMGNYNNSDTNVKIDFFKPDGSIVEHELTVPKRCRKTVNAQDILSGEFSTTIQSDLEIAAERVVYCRGSGPQGFFGATVDNGTDAPETSGLFPEGSQRFEIGATTYLTIGNPDRSKTADVRIECFTADGHGYVHNVSVPPHSRYTLDVGKQNHDCLLETCYDYIESLFMREISQQVLAAVMYVDVTRIYYSEEFEDEEKGIDIASNWLSSFLEDYIAPEIEEFLSVIDELACSQINVYETPGADKIMSWETVSNFLGRADFLANQLLNPCDYFNPKYGDQKWEAEREAQNAITFTWITDRGVVPENAKLDFYTRYETQLSKSDWQPIFKNIGCSADYVSADGVQALFKTSVIKQHTTDLSGGRIATMWFDKWHWEVSNGKALHTVSPEANLLLVKLKVPKVNLENVKEVGYKIVVKGTTYDPFEVYTNDSCVASGDRCAPRNADYEVFSESVIGEPGSQGPIWHASSGLYQRSGGLQAFDQTKIDVSRTINGRSGYSSASQWYAEFSQHGDWHNTKHNVFFHNDNWIHYMWAGSMSGAHKAHTYEVTGYMKRHFQVVLPDYSLYDIPPPGEAVVGYFGEFKGYSSDHANPSCWFTCDYGYGEEQGYVFNKYSGDIRHYKGTKPIPGTTHGWFPEIPLNTSVSVITSSAVYAYDHTHFWGSGWSEGRKALYSHNGACLRFQGYGRPNCWMKDLKSVIGPHKLNEICIPGTHDSGTSTINPDSHVNGETGFNWKTMGGLITGILITDEALSIYASLYFLGPVAFVEAVIKGIIFGELIYDFESRSGLPTIQANWSRAQRKKVGEQLNEGIRYFDLRVVKEKDGDYVLSHSMSGEKLEDVLTDINNFNNAQQDEFILIDINKVYNEGEQDDKGFDHGKLIDYVTGKLGSENLINRNENLELDHLWSNSPRIVLFYCDTPTVRNNNSLFYHGIRDSFDVSHYTDEEHTTDRSVVINPWANTDSTDYLIDKWTDFANEQSDKLAEARNNGYFFVLQAQMTGQTGNKHPQQNRSFIVGSLAWLSRKHKQQFITGPILWGFTDLLADKSPDKINISLEEMAQESNPVFFTALSKVNALQEFVMKHLNIITADFATDAMIPTGMEGQDQSLYEFATAVNMDRYKPRSPAQESKTAVLSAHSSVGASQPSKRWYFAEGSTEGGMEAYILVQNLQEKRVEVDMKFHTPSGELAPPQLQSILIDANSRITIRANDYITDYEVSIIVEAEEDVVCERSIYGNGKTWATSSLGITEPSESWYLAEGSTEGGMETYILVQNPQAQEVSLDISFQTENGEVAPSELRGITIPAGSRRTFRVNDFVASYDVSTKIEASDGIVCERTIFGDSRNWSHCSLGITEPSESWYLAEGSTEGGMETYILVQNPQAQEVSLDISFQTKSGDVAPSELRGITIPAGSRRTFRVNDFVESYDVSAMIRASGEVVCEKSVYGAEREWASGSIGSVEPSNEWFVAEGSTDNGFETWLLIQNPGDKPADVSISYCTDFARLRGPSFTVPAGHRRSIRIGETVMTFEVSSLVVSTEPVVVEKTVYYNEPIE